MTLYDIDWFDPAGPTLSSIDQIHKEQGVTQARINELKAQRMSVTITKTYESSGVIGQQNANDAELETIKVQATQQEGWTKEKNLLIPSVRALEIATKRLKAAQDGFSEQGIYSPNGSVIPYDSVFIGDTDPSAALSQIDRQLYISQKHTVFSPLENGLTFENAVMLLGALLIGRGPQGRQAIKDIVIKYLETCGKILDGLSGASHADWHVAHLHSYLTNSICHRIGLIDDGAYLKNNTHFDDFSTKMMQIETTMGVMSSVTTLISGASVGMGGGSGEGSAAGLGLLAKIAEK